MSTHPIHLTSDLARAARAISQVSRSYVADSLGIEKELLRRFERGRSGFPDDLQARLHDLYIELGVVFIAEDAQGGYGVRQRHNARKVRQLERWEGEGGPAGLDDI